LRRRPGIFDIEGGEEKIDPKTQVPKTGTRGILWLLCFVKEGKVRWFDRLEFLLGERINPRATRRADETFPDFSTSGNW
jgi:hypothetical protein